MPQSDPASRCIARTGTSDAPLETSNLATLMVAARCAWVKARSLAKSRFSLCPAFPMWRSSALIAVMAALMLFGCGTTHATLNFTAPSSATAGVPFTVTVTVLYKGRPDTVINSPIHFTSSDPAAVLPPDYYFTQADAGSHTWNNAFTLSTPGNQTISGSIFNATGINGSASITVSP